MNPFKPRRCDQGEHDWKIAHDYIGDGDVAYGTKRITFRVCRACGIEDHERLLPADKVAIDQTEQEIDQEQQCDES